MGVEISSFGDATHLKSLFTIEKKRRERVREREKDGKSKIERERERERETHTHNYNTVQGATIDMSTYSEL